MSSASILFLTIFLKLRMILQIIRGKVVDSILMNISATNSLPTSFLPENVHYNYQDIWATASVNGLKHREDEHVLVFRCHAF